MKQSLVFLFLLFTLNSIGQNLDYDYDKDTYPDIEIICWDSITSADIYKSISYFTFSPKTPTSKGKLILHFSFDANHKKSEIIRYDNSTGYLESRYIFNYSNDSLEEVTMLNSKDKIIHKWILRNKILLEEKKYNLQEEVTDKWSYSYIKDTLIENIIKYDQFDNVLYELKYKYDSLYRLSEEKEYKNHDLVYIRKMIYDTTGKLDSEQSYPLSNRVWSSGKKSHVVTKKITDEDHIAYHTLKYQYDSCDRVERITLITNDSELEYYETYTYLTTGEVKERIEYSKSNKPKFKQAFEYNDEGRIIGYTEYEISIGDKLQPMMEMRRIRNDSGNLSKEENIYRYQKNKKTVLYTFEYN